MLNTIAHSERLDAADKPPTRDYPAFIAETLRPTAAPKYSALDLFAGCGGLGLGFEAAGFATVGYEMDLDCCETYRANLQGECRKEFLAVDTEFPAADIVIGGPPCQPFSVGGHQHGLKDSRDGFPAFIAAIKQLRPRIWMFENVRGLLYRNRWYLDEIVGTLERVGDGYIVDFDLLNAVHHSVPQNRERLIVVGHRGHYQFPKHSATTVTSGAALKESAFVHDQNSRFLTPNMDAYVAKYEKASKCINPRDLRLDKPARTLTCRNLAGATGDMQRVRLPDGRRRRLTIREAARLQSFPDWFAFKGGETSQFNQIGNAVPPMFAYALATSIRDYLDRDSEVGSAEVSKRWRPRQISLGIDADG